VLISFCSFNAAILFSIRKRLKTEAAFSVEICEFDFCVDFISFVQHTIHIRKRLKTVAAFKATGFSCPEHFAWPSTYCLGQNGLPWARKLFR
jgi:hypothetical protein